tara:strand:- start:148 stop:549 length:402 start_codon:yes stop_codon:yes gene_type:complete
MSYNQTNNIHNPFEGEELEKGSRSVEKVNPYPRKPADTKKELKKALDLLVRLEMELISLMTQSNLIEDHIVRASWNPRAPRGQKRLSGNAGKSVEAAETGLIKWRTEIYTKSLPKLKKAREDLARGVAGVMMR